MAPKKQAGKKLTKRETILLVLLLIVAVGFVYIYFFLLPMLVETELREADLTVVEAEYNQKRELVDRREEIAEEHEALQAEIGEYQEGFFPTTNQEHFIKVLELEFLADNDLNVPAMTYQRPTLMSFGDGDQEIQSEIYHTRIALPYEGSYEGLRELISRLESNEERVRINNLSITIDEEEDIYFGNMLLELYSIPQDDYIYPWEADLPNYTGASAYDRSLFYFSEVGEEPEENDVEDPDEEEPDNGEGDNGNEESDDPEEDDDDETADDDEDEDPVDPGDYMTYRVQPGDTLNQISLDYYGTTAYVGEIMELNNITNPRRLLWGTTIRLPRP